MQLILYTADCTGNSSNCIYPHRFAADGPEGLARAVACDHVAALYRDNYRGSDNFIQSELVEMDCDNDHSDNPADWVTPQMLAEDPDLKDVEFATTPSRHNMLPKNGKSARPRFHFHAPVAKCESPLVYAAIKKALRSKYPFFDGNALDAGRFMFGSNVSAGDVFWYEGFMTVEEIVGDLDYDSAEAALPAGGTIPEGSRNNTLSRFAGRVLIRYGNCDKAYELFREQADKCEPPLEEKELQTIWNSALKFAGNVQKQEGYVPPEQYDDDFRNASMQPEDYSDMGEARVLAKFYGSELRYTDATDYLRYDGECWRENKQYAIGAAEEFLDLQLQDAKDAVDSAEQALIDAGVDKDIVKAGGAALMKAMAPGQMGLYFALLGAQTYLKFVLKRRDFKYIVSTMNAAKPMLNIKVGDLDRDAFLLNTPCATYSLRKGVSGAQPHNPDDLITKTTACCPGDEGKDLWQDALNLFFCRDQDLIEYVQLTVGLAAIGKVYSEQMIIAYGGGANGKSTFWNTIARVLGDYSGKVSAEALTMGCKRNVKPEMAELKGKRLIIASEMEEGTRLNTGVVKQLSSTDDIHAEKKYKDPFKFTPSHLLVLYTNHLPKVGANDEGIWRRLIVIPFNAKITGASDIKNYSDYLFKNAGRAIMAWIIEGARKAIEKNYSVEEPRIVKEAVQKYREANDWLGQFLEDHCELDKSYMERSGQVYQAYRFACMQAGEFTRSTTDFYGALAAAGFLSVKRRAGKFIIGLRLKDGQDFLE